MCGEESIIVVVKWWGRDGVWFVEVGYVLEQWFMDWFIDLSIVSHTEVILGYQKLSKFISACAVK